MIQMKIYDLSRKFQKIILQDRRYLTICLWTGSMEHGGVLCQKIKIHNLQIVLPLAVELKPNLDPFIIGTLSFSVNKFL